jgi:predicted O-methyltransferase YrrM
MNKSRIIYYKYPFLRSLLNVAARLKGRNATNTNHLTTYREENVMGPLQREEALTIFSLVKMTRPQTIVEFGFHCGHSAFNFIQAIDPTACLYSFDIADESEQIARDYFSHFPNFQFKKKSQADFNKGDVEGRMIDFVLLDASHDLALNKMTWEALAPCLSPTAIVAIHDTGTWVKKFHGEGHRSYAKDEPGNWLNDEEYQHCPDERRFVNWVADSYPEFQVLHLHSLHCIRNGITLIQKQRKLPC